MAPAWRYLVWTPPPIQVDHVEMTTNRNKRKRGRTSIQSSRVAKRRKTKNENTTSAHSLPAMSATTVLMLLQPPKKWTSRHLEATRLKLCDNALSYTIAGDDHIPRDVSFWTRVYRRLFVQHPDQGLSVVLATHFCSISRAPNANLSCNKSFREGCCVFLPTK